MTLKNIMLLLCLTLITWFLGVGLTKMKYGIKDSTPSSMEEKENKVDLQIDYYKTRTVDGGYIMSFKGPDSCLYIIVNRAGVIHSATCKNSNHAEY